MKTVYWVDPDFDKTHVFEVDDDAEYVAINGIWNEARITWVDYGARKFCTYKDGVGEVHPFPAKPYNLIRKPGDLVPRYF